MKNITLFYIIYSCYKKLLCKFFMIRLKRGFPFYSLYFIRKIVFRKIATNWKRTPQIRFSQKLVWILL